MITSILSIKQLHKNPQCSFGNSRVIVKDTVDKDFADSAIKQFNYLTDTFGNHGIDKLVILKSASEIGELKDFCPKLEKSLGDDASIAYGVYDKKDKAICLIQDNHKRKDFKYEGTIAEQGSDTLTHEFGHLIDKKYSKSKSFKNAYRTDLEEFARNLEENPDRKIANSDMTYKEAKDYFKHYIEGAYFSDGIDNSDVTKTGRREQWAEAFSIAFDQSENKANAIHKALFKNTYNKFCEIMGLAQ